MTALQVTIRETATSHGGRMLVAGDAYAVQFPERGLRSEEWRILVGNLPQASVPNEADARAWLEFLAAGLSR